MKLSIVVPVYNAAPFLDDCITSILHQNLNAGDYELILVNDGSTDNSLELLTKYANQHEQITLIDKPNEGACIAKNTGMARAKGDYITFIDSDDSIYENSLGPILQYIYQHELDICYLKYDIFDINNVLTQKVDNIGKEEEVLAGLDHPNRTLTSIVYQLSLLRENGIEFAPEVWIGEDTLLNTQVQFLAKRVSAFHGSYYKLRLRHTSVSHQGTSAKAYLGFKNALFELKRYEQLFQPLSAKASTYFDVVYVKFLTRILQNNIIPKEDKEKLQEIEHFVTEHQLQGPWQRALKPYPYLTQSFILFRWNQRYLHFKTSVAHFLKK